MWKNPACISRFCEFRGICRIDKDGGFLVTLQQLYEVINQPVHLSRAPCVWSPLIGTGSHYKSIVNRQTPAYKRTTTISNSLPLYWKKPFVTYCQRKGKWRGHLVKRKKMKNCHVYQSFVGEWYYIPSCLSGPHLLFFSPFFSWQVAPFFFLTLPQIQNQTKTSTLGQGQGFLTKISQKQISREAKKAGLRVSIVRFARICSICHRHWQFQGVLENEAAHKVAHVITTIHIIVKRDNLTNWK